MRQQKLERFNENHDPSNGQFAEGGGSGGSGGDGGSGKPAASEKPSGGGKIKVDKVSDFDKKGIRLDHDTTLNKAKGEKFLQAWNERVKEAPEDFKKEFLGGMPGTMNISYDESANKLNVSGQLQEDGKGIGEYTRHIDLKNNSAYSAYFVMSRGERGGGAGKKLLAANVAMYQQMGLDKVSVSANIDVGGYAWAKYGYVPTRESWNRLSAEIRDKLDSDNSRSSHAASGSGYTPEEWDSIGEGDQSNIQNAWERSTRSEFIESEEQNWRDSGQALDDAKVELASDFNDRGGGKWAEAAIATWREQNPNVPFSNSQILAAIDADYSSDGEGRNDVELTFADQRLNQMQPTGYDPAQLTLPGVEPLKPADLLSEDARREITDKLTEAFNDQAESDAQDADPPSYITDNVSEYQGEYWDNMSDSDRYEWAERNNELPEYPLEDEDAPESEPVEVTDPQRDALMKLAESSDPKAIWAIADSAKGKDLLLNTSWSGVIDFKDKQTMDRFHAYVGKGK